MQITVNCNTLNFESSSNFDSIRMCIMIYSNLYFNNAYDNRAFSRKVIYFQIPETRSTEDRVLNVLRNTVATEIATDPSRRISALDSNWRLFRLWWNSCARIK